MSQKSINAKDLIKEEIFGELEKGNIVVSNYSTIDTETTEVFENGDDIYKNLKKYLSKYTSLMIARDRHDNLILSNSLKKFESFFQFSGGDNLKWNYCSKPKSLLIDLEYFETDHGEHRVETTCIYGLSYDDLLGKIIVDDDYKYTQDQINSDDHFDVLKSSGSRVIKLMIENYIPKK
jgi:hypothetical protein